MLNNPSSLVVNIMQEKYLKNEGLLEAKLAGGGLSYIWRSMWSSLELAKEGMAWRVGDSSRVHIYGWINDCLIIFPLRCNLLLKI